MILKGVSKGWCYYSNHNATQIQDEVGSWPVEEDQYKQLFIHIVRLHIDDNVIETDNQAQQPESLTNNRGEDHFYDLDSDEDCTTQSCIESEVNDYLSNTKQPECLNKWGSFF